MTRTAEAAHETGLTVEDCDAEIERYRVELLAAKDVEGAAVARYQIDRWLDRRLLLMSAAQEWEALR